MRFFLQRVKQGELSFHRAVGALTGRVHGPVEGGKFLRAGTGQRIHRARADQAFHGFFVHGLAGNARRVIEQITKRPFFPAVCLDKGDRAATHALHRLQTEADAAVLHGKFRVGAVDIRRQDPDAHAAAGLDVEGDLIRVGGNGIHQRGHEFHGIILLQPRGFHGHARVGRGVRFVEGVAGEGGHLVINLLGGFFAHAHAHRTGDFHGAIVLHHAVDEIFLFLGHDVVLLFGHGLAHQVAAAQRITRQIAHDLHHLFLIDHAAIGHIQDGFELGRDIGHAGGIVLTADVARDGIHGPGPVERNRGDDILKILRLHGL